MLLATFVYECPFGIETLPVNQHITTFNLRYLKQMFTFVIVIVCIMRSSPMAA